MERNLPIGELTRLRLEEGWDYADPVAGKTWQQVFAEGADKDGYRHKAPDFHEGMLLENQVPEGDTYVAGTIGQLPKTERFWKQQLLREPMPESPNAPIQDYVNPPPDFGGSSDTMPNTYEGVPGFEPDKRGLSPARNSPKVPGTLDAPNIRFPENPQTRT